MFARPEAYLFCFCVKFVVVGVGGFSVFAGVVGGGRLTAVMNAVLQEDVVHTGRHREDTVKPSEAEKSIERPNGDVESD
jgi:hypothetical protein